MKISLAVIFTLGCILFSQDNDVIKELLSKGSDFMKTYYDEVYMADFDLSEKSRNAIQDDYMTCISNIVSSKYQSPKNSDSLFWDGGFFTNENLNRKFFRKRVNITAYENFNQIGVDVTQLLFNRYFLYKKYFNAAIIFTGTVTDSTKTTISEKRSIYGIEKEVDYHISNYKLKIDNIIKGEYIIGDKLPKEIVLYNRFGIDTFIRDNYEYRNNGVTVLNEQFRLLNDLTIKRGEKVIIFITYDFREVMMKELLSGYHNLEYPGIVYSNNLADYTDEFNSIDEISNYMIKLEKINDTPNFFNRSYK